MNDENEVAVIGLGYVGLTTALCFASRNLRVTGVDVDSEKVNAINNKHLPIHEPGLEEFLLDSLQKGFKATTKIPSSRIYFITVGTPSKKDGGVDLSFVERVSQDIGEVVKESRSEEYPLIAVKSTVPPGTARNTVRPIVEAASNKKTGVDLGLCSNPEFLREGSAVEDTINPDRIIIGEHDQRSGNILETIYRKFYGVDKMPPSIRTTLENAELTKYANNAFLATKVSFINEMANICQRIPEADVTIIAKGIGLDKRIGERFLNAGLGWGGSCFPKDIKAMIAFSKQIGYRPLIVSSALEANDRQPYSAVEMARTALGRLKGKRVALLGLAFKPDTDDIREAVSLKIIGRLIDEGAKIVVYDPAASLKVLKIFGDRITYSASALECIKGAECCIIATEWNEFKNLSPDDFSRYMKNPIVIDGRRIFKPSEFTGKGVKFAAIGLGEKTREP